MSKKNKVIVRIGGREYAVRGTESEEYIHKVAIYVDKKMEEISASQPPLVLLCAILTTLNLGDEVIKQRTKYKAFKRN